MLRRMMQAISRQGNVLENNIQVLKAFAIGVTSFKVLKDYASQIYY
jgi:hypothetical protein